MSSGAMGPPPSVPPSVHSFNSFASGSGRNYEVEHLHLLLSASQEDLRLQQQEFDEERETMCRRQLEREKQQAERFNTEQALYLSRIADLERNNHGEGSSGTRR